MFKSKKFLLSLIISLLVFPAFVFAEETITFTTYYPSPAGVYKNLTTTEDTYLATDTGSVGIGTATPIAKLDVTSTGDAEVRVGEGTGSANARLLLTQENGGATPGEGLRVWYESGTGHSYIDNIYSSGSLFFRTSTGATFPPTVGAANTMVMTSTGSVGIGTASPGYKLDVAGDINTTGDVRKNGTAYTNPDYVFEPGYKLMCLEKLKDFVTKNKHLPGMPSTEEVKREGVKIFEQNRQILEKLEEAYLYIIKLEQRIAKLESALQKQ